LKSRAQAFSEQYKKIQKNWTEERKLQKHWTRSFGYAPSSTDWGRQGLGGTHAHISLVQNPVAPSHTQGRVGDKKENGGGRMSWGIGKKNTRRALPSGRVYSTGGEGRHNYEMLGDAFVRGFMQLGNEEEKIGCHREGPTLTPIYRKKPIQLRV